MREEFLRLTECIKRKGFDKLLEWLEKSDFYIAPASTRFHGCYEGGLCEHSINVYKRLKQLIEWHGIKISEESIAIAALLHDLCKVNMYKVSYRNVKENGEWVQRPYYEHEEKFPFGGHGSKSVFLAERFIRLTEEEAVAINCHMSCFDNPNGISSVSAAFEKFPFALMLSFADQTATYIDESKKGENN